MPKSRMASGELLATATTSKELRQRRRALAISWLLMLSASAIKTRIFSREGSRSSPMVSPGKPRGWTSYCSTRTMTKASPSVLKNRYIPVVRGCVPRGRYASWTRRTGATAEKHASSACTASRALANSGAGDCKVDCLVSHRVLMAESVAL
jgi:hypothetical protein